MKEKPFILHDYEITLKNASDYFTLVPFSDVHHNDKACDRKLFAKFCEETQEYKNPYFLGVGDYLDFASTSDMKKIKNADLHGPTMDAIDDMAMKAVVAFQDEIEFMRGRLIGLIGGNHDWVFEDGMTGTEKICEHMGCKYLGWLTITTLKIAMANRKGIVHNLDIAACHGKGGGQLLGSQINNIEKMALIYPDASIFLQGHNHGRGGLPDQVLKKISSKGEPHLRYRSRYYARTGSFQRGYIDGEGTFASSMAMRPANLGWIRYHIQPKRELQNGCDFSYFKIEQIT